MDAREKFGEHERSFLSENFVSPRPWMFHSANIEDLGETKLTVSRGSSQKKKKKKTSKKWFVLINSIVAVPAVRVAVKPSCPAETTR